MSTFFLIFGIICIVAGILLEIYGWGSHNKRPIAICEGIMVVLLGIGMIIGRNEKSPYEIQAELESEAIENYDNGSEVYINGKKNNDIDINGINLDRYNIKIKEGKIYLIDIHDIGLCFFCKKINKILNFL